MVCSLRDCVRDGQTRLAIIWHCAWLAMVSGRCLVTGGMAGLFVYVWHVLSCDWLLGWHGGDFK